MAVAWHINQYQAGWIYGFYLRILSPEVPEGLSAVVLAFNALEMVPPWHRFLSDRLGELGIELGTPGYKESVTLLNYQTFATRTCVLESHLRLHSPSPSYPHLISVKMAIIGDPPQDTLNWQNVLAGFTSETYLSTSFRMNTNSGTVL